MFNLKSNPFIHEFKVKTKGSMFLDFLQTIVLALAFSLFIYFVFLIPSQVEGPSMEPSYYNRELLFADRTVQWMGDTFIGDSMNYNYKNGDVVIFQFGQANLIKRIVGTSGDLIKVSNGRVYVNGELITEPYLPPDRETNMPPPSRATFVEGQVVRVPEGSYFVMGDNRELSKDSRYQEVGFIERSQMKGRVFLRYWPVDKFSIIKSGEAS